MTQNSSPTPNSPKPAPLTPDQLGWLLDEEATHLAKLVAGEAQAVFTNRIEAVGTNAERHDLIGRLQVYLLQRMQIYLDHAVEAAKRTWRPEAGLPGPLRHSQAGAR